jgi:hypothetical protein
MIDKNEHHTTQPDHSAVAQQSEKAALEHVQQPDSANQGATNTVSENIDAKNEQPVIVESSPTTGADGGPTQDVKQDAEAARNKLPLIADSDAAEGGTAEIGAMEVGNTTNDLQKEAIKAMAMKAEKDRLEREEQAVAAERGNFTNEMVLRLDVIESNQPIMLEVNGDLVVGRADNVTDYIPEIDLTPHGAYRLGLSRRHALIRRQEESLIVKDLSSRNGTFVNGEQVKSGGTLPLRDGDELRFGNLALRVNFQRKA